MKTRLLILIGLFIYFAGCQQVTWEVFSSPKGSFSVQMPGTPTENKQTMNTPTGVIDIHMFILEQKGCGCYIVSYNDFPDSLIKTSSADQILDGARDGAIVKSQGKLQSEVPISINTYPGREFHVYGPDGKFAIRTRIYLVKNRLYQVGVVTSTGKSVSSDTNKFLNSFKINERNS